MGFNMNARQKSTCIKLLAVENVSMDLEKCNLFHDCGTM